MRIDRGIAIALPLALGVVVAGMVTAAHQSSEVALVRDSSEPAASQQEDMHYVIDHLAARYGSVDGVWIANTLAGLLPNQEYAINGRAPEPLEADVIEGTIVGVSPGAAYTIKDQDADTGVEVPFDSSDALWRVGVFEVKVAQSLGGLFDAGDVVLVGFAFDGGVDSGVMLRGLDGQRVLLPLDEPGFFKFDGDVYGIGRSGALLGLVSEKGDVSMPVLGHEQDEFLGGLTTLEAVGQEAAQAKPPIDVQFEGAVPVLEEPSADPER